MEKEGRQATILENLSKSLTNTISFDHHDWTSNRNYASMRIYNENGANRVESYLILHSFDNEQNVEYGKMFDNVVYTRK